MAQELPEISSNTILMREKSFFLFSVFRLSPPVLREILYNRGIWYSANPDPYLRSLTANWGRFWETLSAWSVIEYLPELSYVKDDKSQFSFIYNMATHEEGAVGPDFKLKASALEVSEVDIEKYGSAYNASVVFTNVAVLKNLSQWFQWMKDEGVYDNTQILIVADHGRLHNDPWPGEDPNIPRSAFNPLLMHKPFDTRGALGESLDFMSNADSPHLLLSYFGEFDNPYTGNPLNGNQLKKKRQFLGLGHSKYDFHSSDSFRLDRIFSIEGDFPDLLHLKEESDISAW